MLTRLPLPVQVLLMLTATVVVVLGVMAAVRAAGVEVPHPVVQVAAWCVAMGLRVDGVQRLLGGPDLDRRSTTRMVLGAAAVAAGLVAGGLLVLVPQGCALVVAVSTQWDRRPSLVRAAVMTGGLTGLGAAAAATGLAPQVVTGALGWVVLGVSVLLGLGLAVNLVVLARQRAQADASLDEARRAQHAELQHAADHDALTGVLGRRGFGRRLLEQGLVAEGTTGLVLDLDGFKPVNDRHGHSVGDEVLVVVAERFRAVLPAGALLARTGGDEFAAVVPEVPDAAAAEALARRLERCLDAPVPALGVEVVLGVSAGAAWADGPASAVDLLVRADAAMYEAKGRRRAGRPSAVGDLHPGPGVPRQDAAVDLS
ncbi:GGDEF domain-containing protein [Pseudokineococcus marinus]|uniref:GGDEF domain-containing protein n=2 Tax=Pseudokineococcus marinus TaxID=351215 RepID=UPI0031E36AE5